MRSNLGSGFLLIIQIFDILVSVFKKYKNNELTNLPEINNPNIIFYFN